MSLSADPARTERVAPGAQFASDNAAGICPAAMSAWQEANAGYAPGYGDDAWTERAANRIREIFETDADVFFTFNGTAANSLSLAALCQSYHSVICSDIAHVEVDECGGPEFFSNGSKLLLAPSHAGKLTSDGIVEIFRRRTDIHYPKPSVVTVTQSTELGTVYSANEIGQIGEICRDLGLSLHMDGARFANGLVSLGVSPAEMTWKAGVDVLSFGGTKNGLPVGDAVVFFRRSLATDFDYRCKQAGQLASKMRFLSAPWLGILSNDVWLENARQANRMAERFEHSLRKLPSVEVLYPRQANAVFVRLPESAHQQMKQKGWRYYNFIAKGGARLMCSWATTPADVDSFVADLEHSLATS
ncbi:low specificity L-threonine aldolase [bacterium]|nr:low specificity L-threonine aldolase [bacterium]